MDMGLKPSHPRFRELVHKSALQFGSQQVAAIVRLLPVVHRFFLLNLTADGMCRRKHKWFG